MWPRVITEVSYDELGNLQIADIDDNNCPWHESATGRSQDAWLLKLLIACCCSESLPVRPLWFCA